MLTLLFLQGVTALITTNVPVDEFYQTFVIDDSKLQIPKNDALQDTVQVGYPELFTLLEKLTIFGLSELFIDLSFKNWTPSKVLFCRK